MIFVDTSFLLALLNPRDDLHSRAQAWGGGDCRTTDRDRICDLGNGQWLVHAGRSSKSPFGGSGNPNRI